jgi:hypothetical protein
MTVRIEMFQVIWGISNTSRIVEQCFGTSLGLVQEQYACPREAQDLKISTVNTVTRKMEYLKNKNLNAPVDKAERSAVKELPWAQQIICIAHLKETWCDIDDMDPPESLIKPEVWRSWPLANWATDITNTKFLGAGASTQSSIRQELSSPFRFDRTVLFSTMTLRDNCALRPPSLTQNIYFPFPRMGMPHTQRATLTKPYQEPLVIFRAAIV